jgi:hypothetical protein
MQGVHSLPGKVLGEGVPGLGVQENGDLTVVREA